MSYDEQKKKDKSNPVSSATPYDDVYQTLVVDCPSLIIPVVNEIFHENISQDSDIIPLKDEVFMHRQGGEQLERITDSQFYLAQKRYHVECQSTADNTLLLRFFEYDSQIALQDSEQSTDELTVNFPVSAVLYLRHNRNTPDSMKIHIKVSGDECHYFVPVMKVSAYSVDEFFEKKLYFLVPFHIFSYENLFKTYEEDAEKREELYAVYEDIIGQLNQCAKQGLISEYVKCTIIDMSKKVLNQIAKKYENIRKGLGEIMGGQVLEYEAKTILRRGQTQQLLSQISKKLAKGQNFEQIADALEESVETIVALIEEHHLTKVG